MSSTEFNKYINSSEFKSLLQQYENAQKAGEMMFFDSDDIVDIAEYYHIIGDLDSAEAAADYCLRLHPDEAAPLLFKARMALVDYGDVEEAKALLSRLNEEEESLEAVYVKAEIMLSDGGADKSDRYLRGKYASYMESREAGAFSDDMDEDEETPDFALDVAMMYCDHGYSDYAERWMKKANMPEKGPATEYYDTWARIYMDQQQWQKAVEMMDKVIDADAYNTSAWLVMSDAYFHLAQYQEALQCVEYAVAIAPDEPDAYLSKGNILYALNYMEEASRCFERYNELSPGDPLGELLLATTLLCQSRTEEAYKHIRVVFEAYDELPLMQSREALRMCATIAAKMGDDTFAMECCDLMEASGASAVETDLVRGAVCVEVHDMQKALAYFNKAVEASDYDLTIVARIGIIAYEAGLYSVAYKMLKEAVVPYDGTDFAECPPQFLAFFTGACYNMHQRKEYLHYLKYAVECAPLDISIVLGEYFKPGTEPRDYYKIELEKNDKEEE